MKKSLLIAAGLLTFGISAALTPKVNANGTFNVVAGQPGTISFTGSGTAQFNNSLGTNNSFQVGSSTNLGVNASVSSTTGYKVDSNATLGLAGTTTLKQVIGTSGTANAASKTNTRAHTSAMNSMSSWEGGASWDANNNRGYNTQGEWQAAFDREYNREYTTALSNETATESSNVSDGNIHGSFNSKELGFGENAERDHSASLAVIAEYGSSYSARPDKYRHLSEDEYWEAADETYMSAYENSAVDAASRSTKFNESNVEVKGIGSKAELAFSANSNFSIDINRDNQYYQNLPMYLDGEIYQGETHTMNHHDCTSNCEKGYVMTGAMHDENSQLLDDPYKYENPVGTANGSSTLNFSTSSFANQSYSKTASGFIQSFGGNTAPNANVNYSASGGGAAGGLNNSVYNESASSSFTGES